MKLALTAGALLIFTLTGCASIKVRAEFLGAKDLTATAVAQANPSPTPVPRLGVVAYVDGGDIYTKVLPDGRPIRLTQDGENSWPLWSSSGKWIAFVKASALWVMRTDGNHARSLGPVTPGAGQIAWSPTADRLAYISNGTLMLVNANGTEAVSVEPVSGGERKQARALEWSPDGAWLAFEAVVGTGGKTPSKQGLWRIKADGSHEQAIYLSPHPAQTQSHLAGWSPDGKSILFWQGILSASFAADGQGLMIVSASGGTPRRIVPIMLPYSSFLAWSPSGHTLAVIEGGGRQTWANKHLATVTNASALHTLSKRRLAIIDPTWAPDGHTLAAAGEPSASLGEASIVHATASRRIWLIPADGSTARQLTNQSSFEDEHPEWSRDENVILFARIHDKRAELWLMDASGADLHRVVAELTPSPVALNDYGHIPWAAAYDYLP